MRDEEIIERLRARRREAFANVRSGRRWYAISNAVGEVAQVRIYDEIGFFGITAEDFARDLEAITAPEILVAISSPGGDVFDGIAIYNALRMHPARVTARVDSLAASAAAFVVQAGDRRVMLGGSQMMVHEAWGLAIGNAADMRETAELLERQSDVIAGILASRSGRDVSDMRALMQSETWLTPDEAVAQGLADEIVDPAPQDRLAKRTLNDEISETVVAVSGTIESVERVAALRREEGKRLSTVNRESLDGLEQTIGRLHALLEGDETPEPPPEASETEADSDDATDAMAREYVRFVAENV